MNDAEISQYLSDTFQGVDVVVASDSSFFFYNPEHTVPPDYRFQFVTLMTKDDAYDQFSNLNRPSVFRLNIGITKQTFRSLFSGPEQASDSDDTAESGDTNSDYDFTALDQLMPNPVYGRMHWVCILNPSKETFETKVQPLLTEAYELAVSKYNKASRR